MEIESDLNRAHKLSRQAEKLIKKGKYQEAIETHQQIVHYLEIALSECKDSKIETSLRLQLEHHSKQKQVINLKEARINKLTKNLQNLHLRMETAAEQERDSLQDSIYRTFQETESLLEHLKLGTDHDQDQTKNNKIVPTSTGGSPTGAKMPKGEQMIIEELQTANKHLRDMVETMFLELEAYKKENNDLKARIADLEAEKAAWKIQKENPVAVILDGALADSGQLPPLAPLEMPNFDFSVHEKQ